MPNTVRAHELRKYFNHRRSLKADAHNETKCAFDFRLTESSPLGGALTAFAEVVIARLGVLGAFIVLTDWHVQYLLAGSKRLETKAEEEDQKADARWLGESDAENERWLWLVRQTIELGSASESDGQRCFVLPRLDHDKRFNTLSSVTFSPFLKFYAAVPITTKLNIHIGSVFVVDNAVRQALSQHETDYLISMAKKCMDQLEISRERELRERGMKVNDGLRGFINSRAILTQMLEEPPKFAAAKNSSPQTKTGEDDTTRLKSRLKKGTDDNEPSSSSKEQLNPELGTSSEEVVRSKPQSKKDAQEDGSGEARLLSAQRGTNGEHDDDTGETTYRKCFRRAAEYLRIALDVDGVLFVDGLIGLHGALLPTGEPEQELEREMVQRPRRKSAPRKRASEDAAVTGRLRNSVDSRTPGGCSGGSKDPAERTFTSAGYQKNVYTKRPAEILGESLGPSDVAPQHEPISQSTSGLAFLDEGFLGHFMECHSKGKIWYFDEEGTSFFLNADALVLSDPDGDAKQLRSAFPGVRQLLFSPLTDPVGLKRLAGCFAWSKRAFPVFTDIVDLGSCRGFLHSVEAEISRIDTVAAVKQRESFVSSVSHELRTPLHGILGSVELLHQTDLDSFQQGLVDTISQCGSSLHATLSSVLSYAKINQFERRQNEPRAKRSEESSWALSDKDLSTKHGDYHGLYVPTNVAMLCEDTVTVADGGHSYNKSQGGGDLDLALDIAYHENWNFVTEPGALRRIMMNIVGNALKYTTKGFVKVSLDVEQIEKDEKGLGGEESPRRIVVLTVKDSGKGMSREFLENNLFMPFTQEDVVTSEGVGLGMSIVKSLVSLLSGQIDVKSQAGVGTEVKVRIPMELGHSDSRHTMAANLTFTRNIHTLRRKRPNIAIHGFASTVERSLRTYLVDWYNCRVVSTDHGTFRPDILVADECNVEAFKEFGSKPRRYGHSLVLLSVSMAPTRRTVPPIKPEGYKIWKRIPRPLGPNKLSRALLTCIEQIEALNGAGRLVAQSKDPSEELGIEPSGINTPTEGSRSQTKRPLREDDSEARVASISSSNIPPYQEGIPASESQQQTPSSPAPPNARITGGTTSTTTTTTSPTPCILLVEDNAINLKLLETFMLKSGCQDVQTAENGAVAVEAVEKRIEGFDIIFMDISMPVMDGFEATRQIRRLERQRLGSSTFSDSSSSLPSSFTSSQRPALVVALTGLASARDEEEAFRAGVNVFITKPVKFKKLAELFDKWRQGSLGDANGYGKELEARDEVM